MKNIYSYLLCIGMLLTSLTLIAQSDEEQVKNVLREYKAALENLNIEGTEKLFTSQSEILETGKVDLSTHF